MRSRARESMVRRTGSFVVGGRSAVALTFFFCVFCFVVLLLRGVRFFFVAGGRSATLAAFFRSPAAWRSFFFFRSRAARRSFFGVLQRLYGNTRFCHFPALRFKAKPFVS